MSRLLDGLVDRVRVLGELVRGKPEFVWGQVVSVSPLRVRLDGDVSVLEGSPSSTVGVLMPGERVFVCVQGRQVTVVGRARSDTGWVALSLANGWSAVVGQSPRARVVDGVLFLEGAVQRNAGGSLANIASLPPEVAVHGVKQQLFVGANVARKTVNGAVAPVGVWVMPALRRVGVSEYTSVDQYAGWVVPLSGSCLVDQ